jgi:hypothetical protein
MFDFFENFNADQLIPAGYNAIQFIRLDSGQERL